MSRRVVAGLLFAGALALYLATLCPDLDWFDAAEFVNDAVLFEIPHPPGYPLYNLIAHGFTKLPWGTLAARVNAVSAVTFAMTIAALFWALGAMGVPASLAAAAAALFAVSAQVWGLAVSAEVYGLEALLIAVALALIARVEKSDERVGARDALPLAVVCGLALFHRPTTLFFMAAWVVLLWRKLERPWLFVAGMALGAAPYLTTAWVFFTRGEVLPGMWSINYFDFPRDFETFVRICTGTLYAGNLGLLSPGELANEVRAYFVLARDQLTAVVVGLGLMGLVRLARAGRPRIGLYAAALFVGNVGFFLFYNALEKDTMYVPSFLALIVLALVAVEEVWKARAAHVLAIAVALVALGMGVSNLPRIDKHRYHEVRRAVESTAGILPPRAWLYLTDDLIIHPFLHVMLLEGVRRDVQLQIVDGFGSAVKQGLRDRLARREPVYSTLFYPEDTFREVSKEFTLVPRGFLYEVRDRPADALPRMTGAASGAVRGVGVFPAQRRVRRSDQLQVVVTWDLAGVQDAAVVFSWRALTWAHRIGYQGRPKQGGEMTEEYLLKVPWDLERGAGGKADLKLAVVKVDQLAASNTRAWRKDEFFKSDTAGFIRAIERGWPVFAEYLEAKDVPAGMDLGPVELVEE